MDRRLHVRGENLDALLAREWLAVNGLGGYACSTVPGLNTRKYHGLLVAAMAPPIRRMVLLSRVEESLWRKGRRFALDCNEYPDAIHPQGHEYLSEFGHDPFPCWTYCGEDWRLEKRLGLLPGQNTVVIRYALLEGSGPIDLEIRPLLALRPIHDLMYQSNAPLRIEDRGKRHHRIPPTSRTPEVFFAHDGRFSPVPDWYLNQIYRREQERGYPGLEDLWTPGAIRFRLTPARPAHFVCSSEPIDFAKAVELADRQFAPPVAVPSPDPSMDALRRAADQFVVWATQEGSAGRVTSCVTGYPWAAPCGREILIAFTGLFLVTGRFDEARSLLLMFASKLRHGLVPSRFPEDGSEAEYQAADVSLWFINSVWDYLRYTGDETTIQRLLDPICQIIDDYRLGTELGIRADSGGLLASRAPGIPTTWMDAKVGDWVLTPRVGRPVELNALWYNAVRIAAELCTRCGRDPKAESLLQVAGDILGSFNDRFWHESAGCCFDVVEEHGNDPSVRPNQLLAMSLPFAVLSEDRHLQVLERVRTDLLTPTGVRTLSTADQSYQGRYAGGVVSRDRAHHNGSAFPWLLGPYVTALLKVRGRSAISRREAHELIRPCIDYLTGEGLGQLCELFDGDAPHAPGGLLASAAAVGEILRCYAEDVLGLGPATPAALPPKDAAVSALRTRPKVRG